MSMPPDYIARLEADWAEHRRQIAEVAETIKRALERAEKVK